MSTEAQLEAFRTADLAGVAESVYEGIERAGKHGATIDELIRWTAVGYRSVPCTVSRLREQGLVKDSGLQRTGAVGKPQTVWVLGDDREVVLKHQLIKLHKLAKKLGRRVVPIEDDAVDQAAARVFGVG